MTVQANSTVVAEGLGWPELDRKVQVVAGSPPTHLTGLGWPPPGGRAQLGRGSDDGGLERDTLADMQTDGRPAPSAGSVSSEPAGPGGRVFAAPLVAADSATTPSTATVSRETQPAEVHRPDAAQGVSTDSPSTVGVAPPDDAVSRETALDETQPVVDAGEIAHQQPHDTPIAQAAATAVRVLGGRYGNPMPRPTRTRVMTVANQKGGVGKTTSTVNLAAALALHGAEVLVVDLDPQGNASTALGVDHHSDVPSVYDVLIEGRPLDEVVAPVEGLKGLSCVPATIDLAGAEIELVSVVARETRLRKALEAYSRHRGEHGMARLDYILVDCPPSLGLLTVNALVAAEEVLIPIQCEYYALEGLGQLIRNVDLVKAHLNPDLHVSTILLTMYDARTRLASQVADEVRTHFSATVLRTTIPRSVRISEAPSYGQTVLTYDPASTGALSYLEAAREIALRGASTDDKETSS